MDLVSVAGQPAYRRLAPIARGSFACVYLCQNHATGEHVAIKCLMLGPSLNGTLVEREVLNHRRLSMHGMHPSIIQFKEVFLTEQYLCIVMELAAGGNLQSFMARPEFANGLEEPVARWFFQHVIIGLDFCHKKGVVNRDLKLENTLLQAVEGLPLPMPKICDWGYSVHVNEAKPKSKVGTVAYMAPEVIGAVDGYDGRKADCWSAAVMLYKLLFGRFPFSAGVPVPESTSVNSGMGGPPPMPPPRSSNQQLHDLVDRILTVRWSLPAGRVSVACEDLLKRLLVKDPQQRLGVPEILRHPWFLESLPPVLSMNDNFLANADDTGLQSEQEIRVILQQATTRIS